MTEPQVTEEISYRTVTATKGTTTSNKRTIVSRTTNVNAVQVNCYDGDGNLKSKDMDQNSWEERDTHNYEWAGDRRPAEVDAVLREEEANRRVFDGQCQAIESQDDSSGTVVLTSCNVVNTPSIVWTGTVNESESNPDGCGGRSSATQLEGEKWVHSEESVSVSMGGGKSPGLNPKSFGGGDLGNITRSLVTISDTGKEGGGNVVVVPLSGGEVTPRATAVEQQVVPVLSSEERRQMRRSMNREMSGKPAAEK